jgi:hypothetical protein
MSNSRTSSPIAYNTSIDGITFFIVADCQGRRVIQKELAMCNCNNIEIGSFGNQVEITELPPHMAAFKNKMGGAPSICLDRCIAEEVQHLWSLGITTTGCCCGHNKQEGYIGVIDDDIPRMKALGYKVHFNPIHPFAEDAFTPMNGTGHPVPVGMGVDRKYISTYQLSGGSLVFHVFERW